ncbi:hypothetical protein GCM10008066_14250 [Oxalicibacterium faecigallinarum]|uniref:DUF4124 domain-containing protein n=2 Tax=Oxalicibacterium faecigallinarum TaxID=573741 RepID=A0A8J3F114_9BURK|nr:hypothetical protein GCM10008066_14250 [Oxalicibacterium faecigallinarum]
MIVDDHHGFKFPEVKDMKHILFFLTLMAVAPVVMAQGVIYECASGHAAQGKNAGSAPVCRKITSSEGGTGDTRAANKPVTLISASVSPESFPKIDSATQKARDSDRRQILLDETMAEQRKLQDLRREFNNGQPARRVDENAAAYQQRVTLLKGELSRSEQNIAALSRELTKLK